MASCGPVPACAKRDGTIADTSAMAASRFMRRDHMVLGGGGLFRACNSKVARRCAITLISCVFYVTSREIVYFKFKYAAHPD